MRWTGRGWLTATKRAQFEEGSWTRARAVGSRRRRRIRRFAGGSMGVGRRPQPRFVRRDEAQRGVQALGVAARQRAQADDVAPADQRVADGTREQRRRHAPATVRLQRADGVDAGGGASMQQVRAADGLPFDVREVEDVARLVIAGERRRQRHACAPSLSPPPWTLANAGTSSGSDAPHVDLVVTEIARDVAAKDHRVPAVGRAQSSSLEVLRRRLRAGRAASRARPARSRTPAAAQSRCRAALRASRRSC